MHSFPIISCGGNTNIEEADGQLSEGYEIEELYRVGSKFDEDIHIVVLQHLWHIPEIEHLLLQASSSSLVPVHHTNNFFPYVMQVSVQLLFSTFSLSQSAGLVSIR